ncbi:MAG: hypothetical protein JOY90_07050 [Bradyrhizobium sp.]|uniref:hypothetical protein n=1 Tax=Bradyrhizobium sp. TaxID=376 RepID=UPI001D5B2CEC|nr:hypothetical protein [Bradyrhizobium sp.]MBV9560203.1 hypothetical protein [Bradyrhizobium sp.]
MSNERIPTDPYDRIPADPDVERLDDPSPRGRTGLEEEFPDPETGERPMTTGKIALFALCVALVLGAVFYGMNHTGSDQASTTPPSQTAQTAPSSPPAPSGARDVTPRTNDQPGMTTGAASTNRPTPPQAAPQGTEAAPK